MQKIMWGVGFLLVIGALGLLFWFSMSSSGYSAVYLQSGDLYFGKLVRFPTFGLKDVVSIQPTQNAEAPLVVTKFSNIFWGPENFVQISRDKVVWIVKLKEDGQLAKVLKENPNLISNTPQAAIPGTNDNGNRASNNSAEKEAGAPKQ